MLSLIKGISYVRIYFVFYNSFCVGMGYSNDLLLLYGMKSLFGSG